MRLGELAELTGARVEGDPALEVTGAAGLDEAEAGHVTFLSNPRYTPRVRTTRASAVYLAEGVEAGREDIAVLRARV
jgi:UDP-3-O-[3-hydroxymyristoyl] glucosamine N-acyltransferase